MAFDDFVCDAAEGAGNICVAHDLWHQADTGPLSGISSFPASLDRP
jgi:hypothetical protein